MTLPLLDSPFALIARERKRAHERYQDALQARDFARDCFAGYANDQTYEDLIEAEIQVDDATGLMEEWKL